jgi:hypothetical protein
MRLSIVVFASRNFIKLNNMIKKHDKNNNNNIISYLWINFVNAESKWPSWTVPEFIDPVFAKTRSKHSWLCAFRARFRENRVYNFGHCTRFWMENSTFIIFLDIYFLAHSANVEQNYCTYTSKEIVSNIEIFLKAFRFISATGMRRKCNFFMN